MQAGSTVADGCGRAFDRSAVILPAAFVVATCVGNVNLGVVFFVRDLFGATPTQVGWLAGLWSLSYVCGCLLLRPRLQRVPPGYLVVLATGSTAAFILWLAQARSLALVFGLHGLFGLLLALFWPPVMGWLTAGREGYDLGRVVGRFNLSWCAGAIVGPFLCGCLSEQNVHWPLYAGSGLLLATAVYVGVALAASSGLRHESRTHRVGGEATVPTPDASTHLRYPAWIGLFTCYFGMGVVVAVLPVAGRDDLHLSETVIGALFLGRGLANAVAFLVLGRLHCWHFRTRPMLLGQMLGAAVYAGLALTTTVPLLALLLGLLGVHVAVSYANSIFHGAVGSRERTRRMAIHESMLALGLVAGSALGGTVYQVRGLAAAYLLCLVVVLVGVLAQVRSIARGTRAARVMAAAPGQRCA